MLPLGQEEFLGRGHVDTSSYAGLESHSDKTQVGSLCWHCPAKCWVLTQEEAKYALERGLSNPCASSSSLPPIQITASSPSHPANSFYYPRLKSLPPIAKVTFVRLRQSPRAFAPPSLDLASRGNEIVDSLSGNFCVSHL